MHNHDLSFRSSPFAHMCFLVSEALRGPHPDDPPSQEAQAPRAKRSWLDRLDQWLWRHEAQAREAYLAQSSDLADLERRLRALEGRPMAHY
jgi:hypothetical protein